MRSRARTVRVGATLVALALGSAALPAGANQQGFDELAGGSYAGLATAAGVTTINVVDGSKIAGTFLTDLSFEVPIPSGSTTGTWDLSGQTSWFLAMGNLNGTSHQTHRALGSIEGDRTSLRLGATTISSNGNLNIDLIGSQPIDSTDSIGPLDLNVVRVLCDDVSGDWELSWNTTIAAGGFAPTFLGSWAARRLPFPDDPNRERVEEILPELYGVSDALVAALDTNPSQIDGVPILPFDEIWGLLERAIALVNELNNLSACDRALLGEDAVAEFINWLTDQIRVLVRVLLGNLEAQDRLLTPSELLELTTMLAGVGGIGEGAVRQELAAAAQQALESEAERMLENAESMAEDPVGYTERAVEYYLEMFGFGGGG